MHRTRIKICGITTEDAALAAVECGADAIGFVFAEHSVRTIDPEDAWEIAALLPPMVTSVGVFVDPTPDDVDAATDACPVDFAQLHGDETARNADACREHVGGGIIKALRYDPETIEGALKTWSRCDAVEAVLIDGPEPGASDPIDWEHLSTVLEASDHPVILAGGLTPENVGEAIRTVRPFAVDVSSGVEKPRGTKDIKRIAAFCKAVRAADAEL